MTISASESLVDVPQHLVGFLCCSCTLFTRVELVVRKDPQVPFTFWLSTQLQLLLVVPRLCVWYADP